MHKRTEIWLVVAVVVVAGLSRSAEAQQYPTYSTLETQRTLTSLVAEPDGQPDQSPSDSSAGDSDSCDIECCGDCGGDCGSSCCAGPGGFRDNLMLFFAGDGWGNHGDDDDANNFGCRMGFNSAMGGSNVRFQFGASYGVYDFFGREDPDQEPTEHQVFLTGGFYKRSDVEGGNNFSWGVVYDYLDSANWGEEADDIDLGQIRFQIGYATNAYNELGIWSAFGIDDDQTVRLGGGVRVEAKDQVNLYWLHNFDFGGETMLYIGLAEEPNGINQVLLPSKMSELVLGLSGRAPLNDRLALFGNIHYIVPSTSAGDIQPNGIDNSYAEAVWNVSLGVVFYPGAKARARTISGQAGLPLIGVADNATFSVNTPAGSL